MACRTGSSESKPRIVPAIDVSDIERYTGSVTDTARRLRSEAVAEAPAIMPALLEELGELRVRSGHLQHLREFGSRRSGLTARERLALDVLAEQSPLTMGGLANLCSCTKSTMTAVVDRLVRGGYVERES